MAPRTCAWGLLRACGRVGRLCGEMAPRTCALGHVRGRLDADTGAERVAWGTAVAGPMFVNVRRPPRRRGDSKGGRPVSLALVGRLSGLTWDRRRGPITSCLKP